MHDRIVTANLHCPQIAAELIDPGCRRRAAQYLAPLPVHTPEPCVTLSRRLAGPHPDDASALAGNEGQIAAHGTDYRVNHKAELESRQFHDKTCHHLVHQKEQLAEMQQIQIETLEEKSGE